VLTAAKQKRQCKLTEFIQDEGESEESETSSDVSASASASGESKNKKKKKPNKTTPGKTSENAILQQILTGQDSIKLSLAAIEEKLKRQDIQQTKTEERLKDMANKQNDMEDVISRLTQKINSMERKQRERNVRLIGVAEQRGEDCHQLVTRILNLDLNMNPVVEVAHRTGRLTQRPRHIIFRVGYVNDKIEILSRQFQALRNKPYFLVEDLTKMDYETKKSLKPEMDRARREGKRFRFINGSLQIEGENVRSLKTYPGGSSTASSSTYPPQPRGPPPAYPAYMPQARSYTMPPGNTTLSTDSRPLYQHPQSTQEHQRNQLQVTAEIHPPPPSQPPRQQIQAPNPLVQPNIQEVKLQISTEEEEKSGLSARSAKNSSQRPPAQIPNVRQVQSSSVAVHQNAPQHLHQQSPEILSFTQSPPMSVDSQQSRPPPPVDPGLLASTPAVAQQQPYTTPSSKHGPCTSPHSVQASPVLPASHHRQPQRA